MKRLLLILMVGLLAFTQSTTAQRATVFPLIAGDTLTNADTVNKVFTATAGYSALGVQPVVSKLSGTVAGKVYLWASLDGTNYVKTDSLTLSDQTTNTTVWGKTGGVPFVYYKVQAISSGTVSAKVRVYYVERRHN